MKGTNIVKALMVLLVSTICLITWSGLSEAWAKGPGGRTTSNITQPGNTQGSPGALSGNSAQRKKGSQPSSISEITITKPTDVSSPK
jgi:hypothetical protein